MDLIPSHDLTTSLDSDLRTTPATEPGLLHETIALAFGTNIE